MGRGERVAETDYVREGHALASQGNDASSPLTSHGGFSGSTCLLCNSLSTNLRVFPDERPAQIRHTVLRREATADALGILEDAFQMAGFRLLVVGEGK